MRTVGTLVGSLALLVSLLATAPVGAQALPSKCDPDDATLVGTADDDVLTGTEGDDIIFGLGGDDHILGLGGNDILCGGSGHDRLTGGDGTDHLEGGPGRDRLYGGRGTDRLIGGPGRDGCRMGRNNRIVTRATTCERVAQAPEAVDMMCRGFGLGVATTGGFDLDGDGRADRAYTVERTDADHPSRGGARVGICLSNGLRVEKAATGDSPALSPNRAIEDGQAMLLASSRVGPTRLVEMLVAEPRSWRVDYVRITKSGQPTDDRLRVLSGPRAIDDDEPAGPFLWAVSGCGDIDGDEQIDVVQAVITAQPDGFDLTGTSMNDKAELDWFATGYAIRGRDAVQVGATGGRADAGDTAADLAERLTDELVSTERCAGLRDRKPGRIIYEGRTG